MSIPLFIEGDEQESALIYDPIYQLNDRANFRLKVAEGHAKEVLDYLTTSLVLKPHNLKLHIRRILLSFDMTRADFLYAALIDLWIALEDRGRKLFYFLLNTTKSKLKKPDFDLLHTLYIAHEVLPNLMPSPRMSVLTKGLNGQLNLLSSPNNNDNIKRDPLVEAMEYLEYSQVEQAQKVLEEGVIAEPNRIELQENLLEIYSSTLDLHSLKAIEDKLQGNILIPDQWQEVADKILRMATE